MPAIDREAPEFLSPQEIAARYGFDQGAVYRWIVQGVVIAGHDVKLEAVKIGKSWRVPAGSWERFLAACNGNNPANIAQQEQERAKQDAAHLQAMKELKRRYGDLEQASPEEIAELERRASLT